jgi:hypothetical protein
MFADHDVKPASNLEFNGATLTNESGAALIATGLQADGKTLFRDNFRAVGCRQPTLDLEGAKTSGGLDFDDSRILSQDDRLLGSESPGSRRM